MLGDQSAEDGRAFDPFVGQVNDGTVGAWGLQLQGSVWTQPVVVPGVFSKCLRRCRSLKMSMRSVTSVRAVSTNRSA
jgi:hypothetical protein